MDKLNAVNLYHYLSGQLKHQARRPRTPPMPDHEAGGAAAFVVELSYDNTCIITVNVARPLKLTKVEVN